MVINKDFIMVINKDFIMVINKDFIMAINTVIKILIIGKELSIIIIIADIRLAAINKLVIAFIYTIWANSKANFMVSL